MTAYRYIKANGSGLGTGNSWTDAAPFSALNAQLALCAPGDEVNLWGPDAYSLSGPLNITHGGVLGNPVKVRGVFQDHRPEMAVIKGTRPNPYISNTSTAGIAGLNFMDGAQYIDFDHIQMKNFGYGAFVTDGTNQAKVPGINMMSVQFDNCAKAIFTNTGAGFKDAVWRNIVIRGAAKHAINLGSGQGSGDSSGYTITAGNPIITRTNAIMSPYYIGATISNGTATGTGVVNATNIPAGTTVVAVDNTTSPYQMQLSNAPTGSGTVTNAHITRGAMLGNYGCSNIKILSADIDLDWQFGDNFAGGIGISHGNDNIVVKKAKIRHGWYDLAADPTSYWNGDGISTESDDTNLTFEDCEVEGVDDRMMSSLVTDFHAYGFDDAGFDSKSPSATFRRCKAAGVKRCFRVWNAGTRYEDCEAYGPQLRGGSASAVCLEVGQSAANGTQWVGGVMDMQGGTGAVIDFDDASFFINVEQTRVVRPTTANSWIHGGGTVHERDNRHETVDY